MKFDLTGYLKKRFPEAKTYGEAVALPCLCDDPTKAERLYCYKDSNTAYCHRCQQFYPLHKLVQLVEECTLAQAFEIIRGESYNSPLSELRGRLAPKEYVMEKLTPVPLPEEFVLYGAEGKVPKYFKKRGIDARKSHRYNLGYCKEGVYANRLIVPVMMKGECYGFVSRAMWEGAKRKYLNHPQMKSSKLLFNYDVASQQPMVILCEGVFDAMAVGLHAMATFGTNLSSGHVSLIKQSEIKQVVMAWDRDAIDKAYEAAQYLSSEGVEAYVIELPDVRDPDELPPGMFESLAMRPVSGFGSLKSRLSRI